jgi:hypothetical protein
MKKNKQILIGVVILIAVLGAGYYFLAPKTSKEPVVTEVMEEETVETLTAEEIGLTLSARADKKAVRFEVAKASDISHIEYQIGYTKEVSGEEVPEGLIGEINNEDYDEEVGIDYRELGTCSSKVCRYDKVVSDVTITLKITKKDGKIYQTDATLSL